MSQNESTYDRELQSQIVKKQRELEILQAELSRIKYAKQITAFSAILESSNVVLNLIRTHDLNADDCRFLASKIIEQLPAIYTQLEVKICERQAQRKRKSEARSQRSTKQKLITAENFSSKNNSSTTITRTY